MRLRHLIHKTLIILGLGTMLLASSCSEPEQPAAEETVAEVAARQTESRETTLGPVHAVVELINSKPTLGETIELVLTVDAAPDVVVTMPEFGDQMGSFSIADFRNTENVREDGRFEFSQRYTLDLPMSGKLSTPVFLVEFTDNRTESEHPNEVQELLTEAITFDVASVFAEGEVPADLYPMAEELPELVLPESRQRQTIWIVAILLGLIAIGGIVFWVMRRPKQEIVLPPDVVAMNSLDEMSKREFPTDSAGVDAWYVELSGIIRKYIEGQFALHAPRLTTEEFFELVRHKDVFEDGDKLLIRRLLECSDRVKFADYIPGKEESSKMLEDARQFVIHTRPKEEKEPETKEAENA